MRKPRRRRLYGRRLRDESGQALIEFAFVLIMMLILILGMVDFARLFLQYQVMTDAAREAARKAVVNDATYNNNSTLIFNELIGFLAVSGVNTTGASGPNESCTPISGSVSVVTVHSCDWDATTGTIASVGVAIPFEFSLVGPFLGWATGDRTITLRTWFSMRTE